MNHRPATRIAIGALVAAALVPLGVPTAAASPGCLDETPRTSPALLPGLPPIVTADGCDDDTAPETTATASAAPNAAGFVTTSTMTFTVALQVSDGDTGPFGFECRLTGPAQGLEWRTCTSPVTYAGLLDAPAGGYTFEARAVDLGDRDRNPDSPAPGTVADIPDEDPSPATVVWGQDTKVPFVFVTPEAYDEITPTQPVVTGAAVPIRLNSSERGATFECTDNGAAVACSPGRWELTGASAGRHVFTARAIDPAGNASAWAEPIEFFVPRNVSRAKGWSKKRNAEYVRGDALRADRRGSRLVLPRTTVGELRLLAPTAPAYGKVRIRVGRRDWHVVNLAGPRSAMEQFVVIDRFSGIRTGRITIETLSNKPVLIDAVVARPHTFAPRR